MPRMPKTLLNAVRRRLYLVENTRPYYDDGRWLRDEPKLMIAEDPERLRMRMANHGFSRPVYPAAVEVGEYYGPYLPGTERLLREPRDYYEEFVDEDNLFLKKLRDDAEARRRAREEYLDNIEWYQD